MNENDETIYCCRSYSHGNHCHASLCTGLTTIDQGKCRQRSWCRGRGFIRFSNRRWPGKLAAVAAGTLAGYWVGGKIGQHLSQRDRFGIAQATSQAMYSGQPVSWHNPDTGARTHVSVRQTPSYSSNKHLKPAVTQLPAVELVNAYYSPTVNINVRGGPGTDYTVVHKISKGHPVPVIGKVINRDWYLIAEQGQASGFVYVPLMQLSTNQPYSSNAIRHASAGTQTGRYVAQQQQCRIITQQIQLKNGRSDSTQFKACQQADGNWVKV